MACRVVIKVVRYKHDYIKKKLAVKKAGHLNIKTKMASEYSQRLFASQPIRTCGSKLFYVKVACLSYDECSMIFHEKKVNQ